jgi:curved DNA-binding protein CbpA
MSEISGHLADRPILEVIRLVHQSGATGVLEIDPAGHRRLLHFRDGELHLPAAHPLARRLSEELAGLRAPAGRENAGEVEARRRRLVDLAERIIAVIADWKQGSYRFVSAEPARAGDLVGPLPTRRLLMMGAAAGLDEAAALARLGGSSARLARSPEADAVAESLGLLAEERRLLERLRQPVTAEAVAAQSPEPVLGTLRRLVELLEGGLVRTVQGTSSADSEVDTEIVARLEDRIARGLAYEPVDLDAAEHRRQVADLLGRFGGLDHYELLGIRPSAGSVEIHTAYERLARAVHPVHAGRLGFEASSPALRLLFERATHAYATLSDPERRRAYNATMLVDLAPGPRTGRERDEERRALARSSYEQAIAYAAATEFHFAIELLEQAVRSDPRAEYWAALGRMQARNPHWRDRAAESYRAALELEPNNLEWRMALGRLYEDAADAERARAQYQHVARAQPEHVEARERLARLTAAAPRPGGLFDRIFRRNG